jgi:hypothetical protein
LESRIAFITVLFAHTGIGERFSEAVQKGHACAGPDGISIRI